jgi:transposase-like protein
MGEHPRKADGRRGEKTVAELSRELDIAPSVIRNWKR